MVQIHGFNSTAEIWASPLLAAMTRFCCLENNLGISVATVLAVGYSPADLGRARLGSPASSCKQVNRGRGQYVPCVWSSPDQQPSGFMLKKNVFVTLAEDGKADFLQGPLGQVWRPLPWGLPERENWTQLCTQPGKVGISSKGARQTITKSKYRGKG